MKPASQPYNQSSTSPTSNFHNLPASPTNASNAKPPNQPAIEPPGDNKLQLNQLAFEDSDNVICNPCVLQSL